MRRILLGKYFLKIFVSFTALIILCIMGVSVSVYLRVGGAVQNMQYENNQRLFDQIVRNFENFDETVYSICMQLYYADANVRALMFGADVETDIAASITAMNRIKKTVLSVNPMIHSVSVFNTWTKRFYPSHKAFLYEDDGLKELLATLYPYPKLTPLYRGMENGEPVFTYLMFDKLVDGAMNGGIVVNTNAGTFLDAIWPDGAEHSDEAVFLVAGDMLYTDTKRVNEELTSELMSKVPDLFELGKAEKNGYLQAQIQGRRYIVTYSFIEKPQMLLANAQPYDEIASHIVVLRNGVIVITAAILFLMLFIALMVSRMVYRPVGSLVQQAGAAGNRPIDEISFLNELYSQNREQLGIYKTKLLSYEGTLKDFWFRKLLMGDVDGAEPALLKNLAEYGFEQASGFVVCVLRVDRFTDFSVSNTVKDLQLVKFATINIAMEVFAESFANYGVDIKEDHVAIVLSTPQPFRDEAFEMGNITILAQKAISLVREHLGVSLTASVSSRAEKAGHLAMAYMDAASNSDYRFVFGANSVVTPQKVAKNKESDFLDFSFENERVVSDAIRIGDREAVEQAISDVVGGMSGLIFHNIVISMVHLTYMIMETVSSARKTKGRIETEQELRDILRNISKIETADEFRDRLMGSLDPLLSVNDKYRENAKYEALIQSISEFVDKHYGDPNLCLNQISGMAKLSSKHVNHIFQSVMGVSIPKFINDARMKKAASMLENTSTSIKDIALAVGVENQTYFFSIFKKKYGMSPKTYQLAFLMRQNK
jgi:AraC-like DNA-binding protein